MTATLTLPVFCSCHYLAVKFSSALRHGDLLTAKAIYASNNINIDCVYSIHPSLEHYVHKAVRGTSTLDACYTVDCILITGGNLEVVKWIVEECHAHLKDMKGKPLQSGVSHQTIAA
jgi:hypothetical protein